MDARTLQEIKDYWSYSGECQEIDDIVSIREIACSDTYDLLRYIKELKLENERLRNGLEKFVLKNFTGGSKSDREDYVQMVTAKDIYNLRELIK